MGSPLESVSTYFFAKDGNKPHLMRFAFAEDVELEVVVNTDAISFPASAKGVSAIEDILSRRFADDFENIYTFCLSRPTEANRRHFPCHWLVGMSAKSNGDIRVGSGRYDWYFTSDSACLIDRLIITIDQMQVLPANKREEIMAWLSHLPYPWCTSNEVIEDMPVLKGLVNIRKYLREIQPLFPEE